MGDEIKTTPTAAPAIRAASLGNSDYPGVTLRPLHDGDRVEVCAGILEALDLHELTTGFEVPWGALQASAYFDRLLEAHNEGTAYAFGIADSARIVGVIQLLDVRLTHGSARIGVNIWANGDRGAGKGAEALRSVINIAFGRLRLQRLWATVIEDNKRSQQLFQKQGFQEEGTLRSHVWVAGARRDVRIFGLVASVSA